MNNLKKANLYAAVWFTTLAYMIFVVLTDRIQGEYLWNGQNNLSAVIFIIHGIALIKGVQYFFKWKAEY